MPIKKEIIKTDKDDNDKITKISCKIKLIDSSLSNLVDNLFEGLHRDKCTDCKSYLDYTSFECKKNYEKDFNKE